MLDNRLSPLAGTGLETLTQANRFGGRTALGKQAVETVKDLVPMPAEPWIQRPSDPLAQLEPATPP